MIERQPSKLKVAGLSPVSCSEWLYGVMAATAVSKTVDESRIGSSPIRATDALSRQIGENMARKISGMIQA